MCAEGIHFYICVPLQMNKSLCVGEGEVLLKKGEKRESSLYSFFFLMPTLHRFHARSDKIIRCMNYIWQDVEFFFFFFPHYWKGLEVCGLAGIFSGPETKQPVEYVTKAVCGMVVSDADIMI